MLRHSVDKVTEMSSLAHALVQQQADQKAVTGLPAYTHGPHICQQCCLECTHLPASAFSSVFFFFFTAQCKELKSKKSQLVSQTDLHAVCLADFSISACWAYCHCREEPCYTPDCVVAVFLTFSSIRALFKCLLFVHKLVKLVGTSNIRLFSYPGLTGTLISRCRCAGVTGWFLLTQCHQAPCEWHGARVCTGL